MAIKGIAGLLLLGISGLALAQSTAPKPKYGPWGVDYASMDKSVKPGDDFFRYAEGTWLRTSPIAPDKSRAGYNYDLPDETEIEVRKLVEGAGPAPAAPKMRRITDFYGAWMDQAGIEARGTAPLKPYLARIDAVKNTDQLVTLMAEPGYPATINIGIEHDAKNPPHYTAAAGQAPLGSWKDWMTFRFISDHAQYLPKAFDDARFGFYSRTLQVVQAQPERWKRGARLNIL